MKLRAVVVSIDDAASGAAGVEEKGFHSAPGLLPRLES